MQFLTCPIDGSGGVVFMSNCSIWLISNSLSGGRFSQGFIKACCHFSASCTLSSDVFPMSYFR
jgi:hypothetical protein